MIIQVLHCPHCHGTDIVRHGKSPEGKQRYRCRECREGRGRTFLLDYAYAGQSPDVKRQIVDMALHASG
ncbi:MAG: IS1 family transposase, partial [Candidatus Tectomicrobia bacterium]